MKELRVYKDRYKENVEIMKFYLENKSIIKKVNSSYNKQVITMSNSDKIYFRHLKTAVFSKQFNEIKFY